MKIRSMLLVLAVAVLGFGKAQAGMDPTNTFSLGLEAGANFSNFIGSDVPSFGSANNAKLGFVGGGFLCLNFGPSFGIRPEILYEQKGNAISGTTTTTEMDYVEVPVLLKFALGTPAINPAILIGPSFNWNTVATASGGNISNVSSSDIGLVGGLELDVDKFLISGRYELGLQNIQQNSNVQNGTITLLVGYSLM